MAFCARVGLLAFTLACGTVFADSITYVSSFTNTSAPGSTTLQFNQFDQSTGNALTSIAFSLTGTTNAYVLFSNNNNDSVVLSNVPISATAMLEDPLGNVVAMIRPTFLISSITIPGASNGSPGFNSATGSGTDTGTGSLDWATGLGMYVDQGVTSYYSLSVSDIQSIYIVDPNQGPIVMSFELLADSVSPDLLPAGVSATPLQTLSGTAGVSYQFNNGTPTPVPEPATFLLLGSVLSGYGFMYSRRRS
jgi:hypothetical protein